MKNSLIYTIGHSTRSIEEFVAILRVYKIQMILDIRTIPKSRHNPQFNGDQLGEALKNNKIGYQHLGSLGGLRHPKKDSENLGWKNASFRGYADYMQTLEFSKALKVLKEIVKKKTVAVMCAEAVPWRCHRSLVSDALTKQNFKVIHILSAKSSYVHKLTPFLKVRSGKLSYPEINL